MISQDNIKLSIIVPVYNEARYIASALESVLFQNVNFTFEIIVVDDYSEDNTVSIVKEYQESFKSIKLICNTKNRGKGYCVRSAYKVAQGKYFHILDGDDFFSNYDKLQKQVDFLDTHDDYIAVCHNSIRFFPSDELMLENESLENKSYSYADCVIQANYHHTSTFMYRKMTDELPEIFLKEAMRGDTALFMYHVYQYKKKVMYFSDIASAYNFHGEGIWTGIDEQKQLNLQKECFSILLNEVIQDSGSLEHLYLQAKYERLLAYGNGESVSPKKYSYEEVLNYCWKVASQVFQPTILEEAFKGMQGLRHVDQLCELIGRLYMIEKGYHIKGRQYAENEIAFLIPGLIPKGGGVFKEIKELVQMFLDEGKIIHIFSSNAIQTDPEVIKEHFNHPNVRFWEADKNISKTAQLHSLIDIIYYIAPERLYPFVTHNDVVANAVLQKGLAKEIIVDFVYDHGTSFGIFNSSINRYLLKTESQINALAKTLPTHKFLYIAPFLTDKYHSNPYTPLKTGKLITASAAARGYKVESDNIYSYAHVIPKALKVTHGTHYHYGPLSATFKERLQGNMRQLGVSQDRFVHIEWVDDFSASLLENNVDLFIAPFPIPSARISIETMSCGIPVISHIAEHSRLFQNGDFCSPKQLTWKTPADLYQILEKLDIQTLKILSEDARKYYENNNEYNFVKQQIMENQGQNFLINHNPLFTLRDITETNFYTFDFSLAASYQKSLLETPTTIPRSLHKKRQFGLKTKLGKYWNLKLILERRRN